MYEMWFLMAPNKQLNMATIPIFLMSDPIHSCVLSLTMFQEFHRDNLF